jgi:aminoglycoside phosphotransferase (APT) family kinase protein
LIDQELLAYLRARFGRDASYAVSPRPLTGGFVTDVYGFELADAPDGWSGPLVLRVYPASTDRLSVERERYAQEVVCAQGAPAPRVLACEAEPRGLDRPFMIMERRPGRPQMVIEFPQLLLQTPRLFTLPRRHAAAMHLVHALDAQPLIDAFAAAGIDRRHAGPEHWLDGAGALIAEWGFDDLRPGLEWLYANRPPDPARVVICHGDLFGANILETRGVVTGLIDWNLVTVAEPAFDLGGQIAGNEMTAVPGPRVLQVAAMGFGQLLARGLRKAYGQIDDDRVRYYAAMRAFCEMTFKLAAMARVERTRVPERMATWRPDQCARYFLDRTGVRVEL